MAVPALERLYCERVRGGLLLGTSWQVTLCDRKSNQTHREAGSGACSDRWLTGLHKLSPGGNI